VHGLFADDRMRAYWLNRIGAGASGLNYEHDVDETLDRLAEHLAQHIDIERLLTFAK
jgi:adenosylcobyric acid synthase